MSTSAETTEADIWRRTIKHDEKRELENYLNVSSAREFLKAKARLSITRTSPCADRATRA